MSACEELDRLLAGGDVEVMWCGLTVAQWKAVSRAIGASLTKYLATRIANGDRGVARLTSELVEVYASIDAQRAEIARMVKECDGLRAKLRAVKNKTAGCPRLPAEIPADYPAVPPPAGTLSHGEEAGP